MNFSAEDSPFFKRIGLRENLQETIDFPGKYGVFRFQFPLNQSIDSKIFWTTIENKGAEMFNVQSDQGMRACSIVIHCYFWEVD